MHRRKYLCFLICTSFSDEDDESLLPLPSMVLAAHFSPSDSKKCADQEHPQSRHEPPPKPPDPSSPADFYGLFDSVEKPSGNNEEFKVIALVFTFVSSSD